MIKLPFFEKKLTLSLNIDGIFICENFEQMVLQLQQEQWQLWKARLFGPSVLFSIHLFQLLNPKEASSDNVALFPERG